MHERKKKVTLEQIRTLFPFDVPTLAQRVGLEAETLYSALQMHPIWRKDAENILRALSEETGLPLSFAQVEVVTWEDFQVLWVLRASAAEVAGAFGAREERYHLLYARDQQQAELSARGWLEQLPHLPLHSFTPCPNGFTLGDIVVPGYQQEEKDVS